LQKTKQSENRCCTLEGDLEVERLKYNNLKRDLVGREQEIEMLRQQKVGLKDELNDQIQNVEELNAKLTRKSEKILALEEKVLTLKSKIRGKKTKS